MNNFLVIVLLTAPLRLSGEDNFTPPPLQEEIKQRLEGILQATNWFINPQVNVENGVVFLTGETQNERLREWA